VVRQATWQGHVGTPKSGREREIPIADDLLASLKVHRHLRGELVFCREGGRPLDHNRMQHILWRAARRAGLRRVGWHALRHTFASHLVILGRSLKEVQELLGHSSITMTMRYAHLAPQMKVDAVNALAQHAADARRMAPAWHHGDTVIGN